MVDDSESNLIDTKHVPLLNLTHDISCKTKRYYEYLFFNMAPFHNIRRPLITTN